ncbi:MAG: hypothetical protein QM218_05790 [Candidatus Cloacimonadota bacterium]|nr:hypothetical protein [Candidatus Cloacimonadota bacterium]
MKQHDKGSSYQLLRVISQDPKILFNLVKNELKGSKISFNSNEILQPSQSNNNESTIEEFIQGIVSEFPKLDFNSLQSWWASVKQKPSWDFISTCNIDGRKGILLVEAKSHYDEMEVGGKTILVDLKNRVHSEETRAAIKKMLKRASLDLKLTPKELSRLLIFLASSSSLDDKLLKSCLDKLKHHDKIGDAISEARGAISHFCSGIKISRDNHYQLSNRIAYTWKLASMGIPTILLYLGFINDPAWRSEHNQFVSEAKWIEATNNYFESVGASELLRKKKIALANGIPMYYCMSSLGAE